MITGFDDDFVFTPVTSIIQQIKHQYYSTYTHIHIKIKPIDKCIIFLRSCTLFVIWFACFLCVPLLTTWGLWSVLFHYICSAFSIQFPIWPNFVFSKSTSPVKHFKQAEHRSSCPFDPLCFPPSTVVLFCISLIFIPFVFSFLPSFSSSLSFHSAFLFGLRLSPQIDYVTRWNTYFATRRSILSPVTSIQDLKWFSQT